MERALMPTNLMNPDPVFSTSRMTASHASFSPIPEKAYSDRPTKKATTQERNRGRAALSKGDQDAAQLNPTKRDPERLPKKPKRDPERLPKKPKRDPERLPEKAKRDPE